MTSESIPWRSTALLVHCPGPRCLSNHSLGVKTWQKSWYSALPIQAVSHRDEGCGEPQQGGKVIPKFLGRGNDASSITGHRLRRYFGVENLGYHSVYGVCVCCFSPSAAADKVDLFQLVSCPWLPLPATRSSVCRRNEKPRSSQTRPCSVLDEPGSTCICSELL